MTTPRGGALKSNVGSQEQKIMSKKLVEEEKKRCAALKSEGIARASQGAWGHSVEEEFQTMGARGWDGFSWSVCDVVVPLTLAVLRLSEELQAEALQAG